MGTNQRRTAARVVEEYFQRVYDRSGTRGLLTIGFGTITAAGLLVTALVTLSFAGYDDEQVSTVAPFAASGCLFAGLGLLIGLLAVRRMIRVLLDWSHEEAPSSSEALEVWETALALPRALVFRGAIAAYVTLLLNQVLIYRGLDLPWAAFAPNVLGIATLVASAGVASMLFLEYTLRPLTADVARSLPRDFEPERPRFALHTKAILPIPGIVMYTGLIAAGSFDTGAGFTYRIVQAVSMSLAIALVAVALYYVLAHAFLDPIDQLTAATQRVHAGDLDTRVPVVTGDELGRLAIGFNQMLDGLQEREQLRSHNTELGLRLEESLEDVRASRARIVAAADNERRRMERDLHDGAQQRLVMISLKLGMAADLLKDVPEGAELVRDLRADAARAVDELRDLAHGIYPPLLESDGLASALEDVSDQSPVPVTVQGDPTRRYPSPVEAAVYFCCLEALQNATKHAGDCRVLITLGADADGVLRFAVADDGRGFDLSEVNGTAGVQNMKDRIGALGGTLDIVSTPGAGTRVEGTVSV